MVKVALRQVQFPPENVKMYAAAERGPAERAVMFRASRGGTGPGSVLARLLRKAPSRGRDQDHRLVDDLQIRNGSRAAKLLLLAGRRQGLLTDTREPSRQAPGRRILGLLTFPWVRSPR